MCFYEKCESITASAMRLSTFLGNARFHCLFVLSAYHLQFIPRVSHRRILATLSDFKRSFIHFEYTAKANTKPACKSNFTEKEIEAVITHQSNHPVITVT